MKFYVFLDQFQCFYVILVCIVVTIFHIFFNDFFGFIFVDIDFCEFCKKIQNLICTHAAVCVWKKQTKLRFFFLGSSSDETWNVSSIITWFLLTFLRFVITSYISPSPIWDSYEPCCMSQNKKKPFQKLCEKKNKSKMKKDKNQWKNKRNVYKYQLLFELVPIFYIFSKLWLLFLDLLLLCLVFVWVVFYFVFLVAKKTQNKLIHT